MKVLGNFTPAGAVLVCLLLAACGNTTSDSQILSTTSTGLNVTNWEVVQSTTTRGNISTTTNYTYNSNRLLIQTVATTTGGTSPETVTTTIAYDNLNNPTLKTVSSTSGTFIQTATSYVYSTDPSTLNFILEADTATTGTAGTSHSTAKFTYTSTGKTVQTTAVDPQSVVTVTVATFDVQANLVSQVVTVGSAPPVTTTWTNAYDSTGTLLLESKKFDVSNNLIADSTWTYTSFGAVSSFVATTIDPVTKNVTLTQTGTSTFDQFDNLISGTVTTTSPTAPTIIDTMTEKWLNVVSGATSP